MSDVFSAKERLAASRAALMRELQPRHLRGSRSQPPQAMASDAPALQAAAQGQQPVDETEYEDHGGSLWAVTKRSLRAWWEFHPARAAASIARPVVEEYAQHSPWKLVGIAAGVGALVVVTRPWKLVSVGGLAVAALKSSQFSNLALSLLATRNGNPTTTKDHE